MEMPKSTLFSSLVSDGLVPIVVRNSIQYRCRYFVVPLWGVRESPAERMLREDSCRSENGISCRLGCCDHDRLVVVRVS
jgi:hypothetical protein